MAVYVWLRAHNSLIFVKKYALEMNGSASAFENPLQQVMACVVV